MKKKERKPSKSYKKNSIDKQQKKQKLKNKLNLLPKRRKLFKKDSNIFNLKNQKIIKKKLIMRITESLIYEFQNR